MSISSGELAALLSALFWALGVVLMKRGGKELSTTARNFCRHLFVTILFLLLIISQRQFVPSLGDISLQLLFLSSIFGIVLSETFFMKALSETEAATITIAGTLYTPIVVIFSIFFLQEALTSLQLVGGLFIIAGSLLAFPRFSFFYDLRKHQ